MNKSINKLPKNIFSLVIGMTLSVVLVFTSCEYDPVEPDFGYIYIKSALTNSFPGAGLPTSGIMEAWVAVDGVEIGTYVIPGIVPLQVGKDVRVTIFPGIRKNDLLLESTRYPMYKEVELTLDIESQKIDTLDLSFKYKAGIVVELLEDFEAAKGENGFNDILDTSSLALSKVSVLNTVSLLHGQYDGHFVLNELNPRIHLGYNDWTGDLKKGGAPVWLELDCKTDEIFTFLIRGIKNGQVMKPDRLPLIFSSPKWKKVYLDLTEIVNTRRYDAYQLILFSAIDPTEMKGDIDFKIDNIKILHL